MLKNDSKHAYKKHLSDGSGISNMSSSCCLLSIFFTLFVFWSRKEKDLNAFKIIFMAALWQDSLYDFNIDSAAFLTSGLT